MAENNWLRYERCDDCGASSGRACRNRTTTIDRPARHPHRGRSRKGMTVTEARKVATSSAHECSVSGCLVRISAPMLACHRHWYGLPAAIRDRVWRAYRARDSAPMEHKRAVAEALDWYRTDGPMVAAVALKNPPEGTGN